MSMEKEIPTVFISYAWEDDVQQYAIDIGTRLLNEEGIEVLLDVWDTHVGHDLNQFMLQCVDNPDVNHVLIFCSPLYAEKVRTNIFSPLTFLFNIAILFSNCLNPFLF